jgi:trk system potassium uptake protein TrkH
MAMILLGVAVLPLLAVGGMQIYRAETPGPTQDKITTRISETARFLWGLYVGLTVALGVLYAVCGMGIFDAVCHAMTTLATGGFSTHDASFGHFDSGAILLVAIAGMLLGGTSFVLLHRSLTGGVRWSEQTELRTYVGFFALATALVSADLLAEGGRTFRSLADLILHAGFQVASILTTTGYTSHDYELWPALSRGVLFALFLVGGMAGSTAGGVKVIRIALLARLAFSQFFRLLHPHAVSVVSLGRGAVNDEVLASAAGFVMLWIGMLGAGTGVLALLGNDFFVSLGVALASLGNVGTGFGEIGASETYASFGASSKLVLAALMFLGRLEIYTVLIILTPGFWRR